MHNVYGVRFDGLQCFADFAAKATSAEALRDAIHETGIRFGSSCFSLVWHVPRVKALTADVGLATYPAEWMETVVERELFAHDPVIAACRRSVAGFNWSDVPSMISLTKCQREVLDLARAHGLDRGYTVPLHMPGELSGSCSFALGASGTFSDDLPFVAPWIAATAFDSLRRIVARQPGVSAPALSQRQIDCVTWVCRGKSYRDIGTILGIGEETVRTHIKIVMQKWNVASRVQLAARALQDGIVSYWQMTG